MIIEEQGVINCGVPGTDRAVGTFPAVTLLWDGTLIASYRVGSSKDSDDECLELRRSRDSGRTWSAPERPFSTVVDGIKGSLRVVYMTPLADYRLIACALWVDRETYPGRPLFNEQTEGCLPMAVLLAESCDFGRTWTGWRSVAVPPEIGPPSLTSPLIQLASGSLAIS